MRLEAFERASNEAVTTVRDAEARQSETFGRLSLVFERHGDGAAANRRRRMTPAVRARARGPVKMTPSDNEQCDTRSGQRRSGAGEPTLKPSRRLEERSGAQPSVRATNRTHVAYEPGARSTSVSDRCADGLVGAEPLESVLLDLTAHSQRPIRRTVAHQFRPNSPAAGSGDSAKLS